MQPKPRTFESNWWGKTKLAISGANSDGTSNTWGKVADIGLPVVLGAVAGWFTNGLATGLGVKAGNLINTGLNSWGDKIMNGTDTQSFYRQTTNSEQRNDGVVNALGNVAGTIAGMVGQANGVEFDKNSTLGKIFGFANNSQNSQFPVIDQRTKANFPNSDFNNYSRGRYLNEAGNSILSKDSSMTGQIGDGIFSLGDKSSKKGLPSTIPYNIFSQNSGAAYSQMFANGGEPTAAWRDFVSKDEAKVRNFLNFETEQNSASRVMQPDATRVAAPSRNVAGVMGKSGEAYQYLTKNKGLTPTVAAAFLGNLMQESGLDPSKVHDNGTGYGIAGWRDPTPGKGRKTALFNYMKTHGKPVDDLFGQLDFLVDEANQRKDIQRASQFSTPEEASSILSQYYFRPLKSAANNAGRAANSVNILKQNNTMATKKFRKGGVSTPYVFFEGGGQSAPAEVFGDREVNAIREFYQLDNNETVNSLNFNMIVGAGLHGMLPISPDAFKGSAREGLLAKINSKATFSGSGYGSGDAKVVGKTRVGAFYNSVPSVNPEGFTVQKNKGTLLDPGKGTSVTFPKKKPVKNISPFVFFKSGGQSTNPDLTGKK
ncbi:phage tail tip lysozyme [Dyadobacter sp. CY312]|uniref:phage tail tip lysozyme n=1 Tax=Dyadobacter sp. CY312 TaxID=2907303 RepID=UPI001F3AF5D9|nr:phage tail tip lysozyme [Dyadobacter sp. CY312]MCE7039233.1 phage tail tip lysozyme [Dyadobacter sp. CY312]